MLHFSLVDQLLPRGALLQRVQAGHRGWWRQLDGIHRGVVVELWLLSVEGGQPGLLGPLADLRLLDRSLAALPVPQIVAVARAVVPGARERLAMQHHVEHAQAGPLGDAGGEARFKPM